MRFNWFWRGRRFAALALSLLALKLAIEAAYFSNGTYGFLGAPYEAYFALILAVIVHSKFDGHWPSALQWIMLFAVAALMMPVTVAQLVFGEIELFSFAYHLIFGTQGVDWLHFSEPILRGILIWGVIGASLVVAFHKTRLTRRWFSAGLVCVTLLNPILHDYARARILIFGTPGATMAAIYEPVPMMLKSGERPNLVILYLEGLERTYAKADLFGDAYAPLTALEPDAKVFTDIRQIRGTGWSIAGVVASMCGVPLLPGSLSSINDQRAKHGFLSGIDCLPDILAQRGYAFDFILGADPAFGGIDRFVTSHGGSVHGVSEIAAAFPEAEVQAASNPWGVDDQMTLDYALAHYRSQRESGAPFLVAVETIGPHGPGGYMSRDCTDHARATLSDSVLPAVRCTGVLVTRFLQLIEEDISAGVTRVVLLSDHLAHKNDVIDTLRAQERRNTVMFLGTGGGISAKPGSMIDVFPTILDWLNIPLADNRAGLGVSLKSRTPTLVETIGEEGLDIRLSVDTKLSDLIWR